MVAVLGPFEALPYYIYIASAWAQQKSPILQLQYCSHAVAWEDRIENTASDSSVVGCITAATLTWVLLCRNLVTCLGFSKHVTVFYRMMKVSEVSWFPSSGKLMQSSQVELLKCVNIYLKAINREQGDGNCPTYV
jgi:hypothetical protein